MQDFPSLATPFAASLNLGAPLAVFKHEQGFIPVDLSPLQNAMDRPETRTIWARFIHSTVTNPENIAWWRARRAAEQKSEEVCDARR